MTEPKLSFFARLSLAFAAFFRTLSDAQFAARIDAAGRVLPALAKPVEAPERKVSATDPRSALQLLALLQREGRFVDFLGEDIASFSDAQVGAAARVVHSGCKKALHEHFVLVPVRHEAEGARVILDAGFDPSSIRLTGHVAGLPPHAGTLRHCGYRVDEVKLPKLHDDHAANVIQPAEVEL